MQQPGASQSAVAPVSHDYHFLMLVGPRIVSQGPCLIIAPFLPVELTYCAIVRCLLCFLPVCLKYSVACCVKLSIIKDT